MNSNISKRPTFEEFRKLLLEQINLISGSNIQDPFYQWEKVGNSEVRLDILEDFYKKIFNLYGIDIEVDKTLANLNGFIESVAVQIYHAYSTMHLVERINIKIRAKMN